MNLSVDFPPNVDAAPGQRAASTGKNLETLLSHSLLWRRGYQTWRWDRNWIRILGLVVLVVAMASANSAEAQGVKDGKHDLDDTPTVVARWKHQPGNNVNTLYSNGKVNNPSSDHTWTLKNSTLVFRWKDAKAPGGFWIDTCTVSADGQTYKGTNQLKHPISGVLVKDQPAKPGAKPDIIAKSTASDPGSGAKPNSSVGISQEDVWKVLQLVSLDYEVNFKKVPRDHSLPPYVALMSSKNARVREVAALSAQWEIDVWEVQKAFKSRVGAVENFLGVPTPRPANAQPDPVQPEIPSDVKSALAKANREGLLVLYNMFDSLAKPVQDEGKKPIGQMSQSSAEYYRTQLVIAMKQVFLWSRAEALAKAKANGDNTRANDIEVEGVFDRGKTWGTVIVRNKSTTDLDHVTVTCLAPKKALPPGTPALDFILGAGVGGDIDSNKENVDPNDLAKKMKAGLNLVSAAANDRAVHEMPVQVFVHIPKLAPNAECEIRLFRTSAEFGSTVTANYSVWGSGVAVEGKPLPGFDAAKKNKTAPGTNPMGNSTHDPKDPLHQGSIWRGSVKWTQKGVPDLTRTTELTVTARNGDKFKGTIKYSGSGALSDIVGEVANGTIKWEFVSSAGKAGLLHTGTIKAGHIEVNYEEDGDKPRKSVTTLNHVPDGKTKQNSKRQNQ